MATKSKPKLEKAVVRYRVPVLAEVDLVAGRVERVVVIDEEVEGPLKVTDGVHVKGLPLGPRKAAIEIAENTLWPEWEVGPW